MSSVPRWLMLLGLAGNALGAIFGTYDFEFRLLNAAAAGFIIARLMDGRGGGSDD